MSNGSRPRSPDPNPRAAKRLRTSAAFQSPASIDASEVWQPLERTLALSQVGRRRLPWIASRNFYSSLDLPWFSRRESLPVERRQPQRRFSPSFLQQERLQLHRARRVIRLAQAGLPADPELDRSWLVEDPRRLVLGEVVSALHPVRRTFQLGVVVKSVYDPRFDELSLGSLPPLPQFHTAYLVRFLDSRMLHIVADFQVRLYNAQVSAGSPAESAFGLPDLLDGGIPESVAAPDPQMLFPHSAEDLGLLARVLYLLDRKKALVDHLRLLHDHVIGMCSLTGTPAVPVRLHQHPILRRELEVTSGQLESAVRELRTRGSRVSRAHGLQHLQSDPLRIGRSQEPPPPTPPLSSPPSSPLLLLQVPPSWQERCGAQAEHVLSKLGVPRIQTEQVRLDKDPPKAPPLALDLLRRCALLAVMLRDSFSRQQFSLELQTILRGLEERVPCADDSMHQARRCLAALQMTLVR